MVMGIGGGAVYAEFLAKIVHQLGTATEGAGEGAADADVVFPGRILAETRIESDYLQHLDRLQLQFRGDPFNGFLGDEAESMLDDVEQR